VILPLITVWLQVRVLPGHQGLYALSVSGRPDSDSHYLTLCVRISGVFRFSSANLARKAMGSLFPSAAGNLGYASREPASNRYWTP
jgi:hypothetical protein